MPRRCCVCPVALDPGCRRAFGGGIGTPRALPTGVAKIMRSPGAASQARSTRHAQATSGTGSASYTLRMSRAQTVPIKASFRCRFSRRIARQNRGQTTVFRAHRTENARLARVSGLLPDSGGKNRGLSPVFTQAARSPRRRCLRRGRLHRAAPRSWPSHSPGRGRFRGRRRDSRPSPRYAAPSSAPAR